MICLFIMNRHILHAVFDCASYFTRAHAHANLLRRIARIFPISSTQRASSSSQTPPPSVDDIGVCRVATRERGGGSGSSSVRSIVLSSKEVLETEAVCARLLLASLSSPPSFPPADPPRDDASTRYSPCEVHSLYSHPTTLMAISTPITCPHPILFRISFFIFGISFLRFVPLLRQR
jgi:hypothetical protein